MNSIIVAKMLFDRIELAGRRWYYPFRALNKQFDEKKIKTFSQSLSNRYATLTKSWNSNANSEWICRIYLTAKSILNATLLLNSLDYSGRQNVRVTSPYLAYYSVLSLLRGLLYTIPEMRWDSGKILEANHSKVINVGCDVISHFDKQFAVEFKEKCFQLKASRELISYYMPTQGDSLVAVEPDLVKICTLLAEISQFNSEILEQSIVRNAKKETFIFDEAFLDEMCAVTIEGIEFRDGEDRYRLNYLRRKYPFPPNVLHIMTEGWTEDFFGAWCSKDDTEEVCFNPDSGTRLIFDIP